MGDGTNARSMKQILSLSLLVLSLIFCGCPAKEEFPPVTTTATPVANAGELKFSDGKNIETYFLQSVSLSAAKAGENKIRFLTVTGEAVGANPEVLIFVTVPPEVLDTEGVKDIQALKQTLPVVGKDPIGTLPSLVHFPKSDEKRMITGGTFQITSITGEGPWEIDAAVAVELGASQTLGGTLKAKLEF